MGTDDHFTDGPFVSAKFDQHREGGSGGCSRRRGHGHVQFQNVSGCGADHQVAVPAECKAGRATGKHFAQT